MQRAGWCAQGNCLPILAVGRTEVSPGWRVTAARLPNPKLPCYKPPMTPPKLWELTFVPREAPKQYASLTCSSTQIILDKLLEFGGGGGGGGVRNIAYRVYFIMYLHHKYQSQIFHQWEKGCHVLDPYCKCCGFSSCHEPSGSCHVHKGGDKAHNYPGVKFLLAMGVIPEQINGSLTHGASAWCSSTSDVGSTAGLQRQEGEVREVTAEEPSIHVYPQAHS